VLGGPLGPPNTDLMTWGNPKDEWGPEAWRNAWKQEVFVTWTIRYRQPNGQAAPVCLVVKPFDVRTKMAAISSHELRFRCSLARWTRMDEGYNAMVFDLYFGIIKKTLFPTSRWLSLVAAALHIVFSLLPLPSLSHKSVSHLHTKRQEKGNKILIKLLTMQYPYESEWKLEVKHIGHNRAR
jgi:hypothetical protein